MKYDKKLGWRDRGRRRFVPSRCIRFRKSRLLRLLTPFLEFRFFIHPIKKLFLVEEPEPHDESPGVWMTTTSGTTGDDDYIWATYATGDNCPCCGRR